LKAQESYGYNWDPFIDNTVFSTYKKLLGGNVRVIFTGSAPINPDIIKYLRIVFGVPIVEGYGLAETCGGSFFTQHRDVELGYVGGPITSVEVKLQDIPDFGFYSYDTNDKGEWTPKGEICLRGPTLFKGYYKDEDSFNESVDSEGWFHTGDIAMRLPHNGAFKYIDRVSSVFKLSNGLFVPPGKLETIYSKSNFVNQILVYGDPSKDHLVAVVVPDMHYVKSAWECCKCKCCCSKKCEKRCECCDCDCCRRDSCICTYQTKSNYETCQCSRLKEAILCDLAKIHQCYKIPDYKRIRNIYIESTPWTEEDILTSTHKINRKMALSKYGNILDRLFDRV